MKKILLIEDNADMRENIAEILELASYDVTTAPDGKEGVRHAQEIIPDLIICDIMMPELDGYGVLHILGKDPKTARIPFIFLTAKAEKSDMRKGMNLGADDYISKPFDDTELLDAVEVRLKKSDFLQKEFAATSEGLNEFLSEARGLEELKKLSVENRVMKYRKKDTIFHEKDYPRSLYFILKGKVKTLKSNDEGKEYITGLHNEGEFLGYEALLQGSTYSESAAVLEDTEITIIPAEDFNALIYKNRDVADKFIKLLSNNLKEKQERLLKLAYNSIRKRVADALIMLYDRYKKEGSEAFSMAIPREDLAGIVGTAPESVIRALSDFKSEKLIEIKGSSITILNADKLKNMKN
jgi:CRP-like cAMP-binding protein